VKPVGEVVACVVDYGTFASLSEKLAETMAKVFYYSPFESEYLDCAPCFRGMGLDNVERVEDYLDPKFLASVDLFVFPDRGFGGLQRHLRDDMQKAVWGSQGLCRIEEFRTEFIDLLRELEMPMVQSVEVNGLSALVKYLRTVNDKWIKIDRYRSCMETWKHIDFDHSVREFERLAKLFGPMKEQVDFIVQDVIETDVEIGYDGWSVDGLFPLSSFQGYEGKNETYLGRVLPASDIPEEVRYVNEKLALLLRYYGYRNFWSTEIRVKDGEPFFIDPTPRMPGQTGEQLMETCTNLPDIIWSGANGEMIEPEFAHEYAVEVTLHYTAGSSDSWKGFVVPDSVSQWLKPYHYCRVDGMVHVLPHERSDEVGVMIGVGETAEEAIEHLKTNLEEIKDEPISADVRGFVDLLEKIKVAEEEGMHFSDEELPEADVVL